MIVLGHRIGPLLSKTGREIREDQVPTLAGSTAYYFFFSLFPLLLFLAPLLGLLGDRRRMMEFLLAQLSNTVPASALGLIRGIVEQVVYAKNAPGLMSIGALLAAYSGSQVFGTLMTALNTAYDVTETRSWIRQMAIRLGALAASSVIVALATVMVLGGGRLTDWLGGVLGMGATATMAWKILQLPLAFGFLVALAFMMFYLLPNVKQHPRQVLISAVVTTALWFVVTLVFRVYVQRVPSFGSAYGALGGVIALLTWMYFSTLVVLSGGELASELHAGTGAVVPPKGAVYLGRLVSGTAPGRPSIEPMRARE